MTAKKEEDSGLKDFKVTDRRTMKDEDGTPEASAAAPSPPPPEPEPDLKSDAAPAKETAEEIPPVDFAHLVMSFSHTALMQLGDIPDPITGKRDKDLESDTRTIDILALLHEKTRGNLSQEEEQLLEGYLSELRARYLKASGFISPG
jgi:hypothetical protein